MIKQLLLAGLIALVSFTACNNKPSETDLKKKILSDYVCREKAEVNGLQIVDTKDAESIFGNKGFEYVVTGEVMWPAGCKEYGTNLPEGFSEKFENKRVFLIKTDDGWQ